MTAHLPKAGDLLRVGREASVQFTKPILFRVIRVLDRPTYHGWIWLEGYQIDNKGDAVDRRSIFVMKAGLRIAPAPAVGKPGQQRRLTSPQRR
ncbi:hypothetical protein Vqi01_32470 [Micromonospora qiuiae]|uniref:Uncharacterized protein n=1 Tax=Micromonospora qiuiae TaxID=502268 RepID=A0ABQ4JDR3_9ACTN|nr:hypothetical protein [Micromonospora qiuiae]GIJ28085.1 hypothetical protein Vqi01_32470 [Micromonospora qiuiae]